MKKLRITPSVQSQADIPIEKKILLRIATGGEEDPKKKVYKTQQEVDAANAAARDFHKRRNLLFANEAWVAKKAGDPVVEYKDINTGKPYDGRYSKMPASMIQGFVPDHVKKLEWSSEWQMPYYLDDNDNIIYVARHHYNSDRFRTSQKDQDNIIAMRNKK